MHQVEEVLIGLVQLGVVRSVRVRVCKDTTRDSANGSWYSHPCAANLIMDTFPRLNDTGRLTTLPKLYCRCEVD